MKERSVMESSRSYRGRFWDDDEDEDDEEDDEDE